jgi:hypothetical protein
MAEEPQTTKIVLVLVLAVVLAIVLLARFGILPIGSGQGGAATPAGKSDGSASAAPDATDSAPRARITWERPDPVGPIGRDPTRLDWPGDVTSPNATSIAAPVAGDPEYTVSGVMYSTEQPSSVIINGHVLHEGDTIYGAVIVKITEGRAELSRGGRSWVVMPGQQYRGSEVIRSQN